MELDIPRDTDSPVESLNFYSPLFKPLIRKALKEAIILGKSYDVEAEVVTAKGNYRWVRTTGKAYQKDGITISISGAVQDITEKKMYEDELHESREIYKKLSFIDVLTNLHNRRHFDEQLRKEVKRASRYHQPLTLLFFDIDNFKMLNDDHGHTDGDNVLSLFSKILKKWIRVVDFAHRYGGEEFTAILPSTALNEGVIVAEKIRHELSKETVLMVSGKELQVTVSVGVAEYQYEESLEQFIQRADKLMYKAKSEGKNKVCFK